MDPTQSAWNNYGTPLRGGLQPANSHLSPLSPAFTPSPQTGSKVPYAFPAAYYTPIVALAPQNIVTTASVQAMGGMARRTSVDPTRLADYHSVTTLGTSADLYRAIKRSSGASVLLKRVPTGSSDTRIQQRVVRKWQWVQHPNLISLNRFLVSPALSQSHDECVAEFAYLPDLAPLDTLKDVCTETTIWSIIVQLACLLRHVHGCGTPLRCLAPSKVFLGVYGRVYVLGAGCADVVPRDASAALPTDAQLQTKDLEDLGLLLLHLTCVGQQSASSLGGASIESLQACPNYTQALKQFILALLPASLARPQGIRAVTKVSQVCDLLGTRIFDELATASGTIQSNMLAQMQQLHHGRAMRVLTKLGFVLDRPENDKDPRWSESGERYALKLFRSHVFHQMDENGAPLLDWGHVATCLHKLDVGSEEKLLLLSRDETTVMVTSYADIRNSLEISFAELQESVRSGRALATGHR